MSQQSLRYPPDAFRNHFNSLKSKRRESAESSTQACVLVGRPAVNRNLMRAAVETGTLWGRSERRGARRPRYGLEYIFAIGRKN